MERVQLGSSGLEVSKLCLGAWNMGGQKGWGPESEDAAVALIHHVLDSGCNFIDTARGYGRGRSEEIVGKGIEGRRDQVVIATKMLQCAPDQVTANIEASLTCLDTDYIDLYICHWPVPSLPLEPFFEEMVRQREAGKIRAIGVSNFNRQQMETAAKFGVVSLQPPFSILWRVADDVLDFCRGNGVAVTPYSPLAQGLLTGRYTRESARSPGGPRDSNVLFSEDVLPDSLKVAAEVDRIADRMGCTSAQVALAWVLRTPGITCALVGASRPSQWDENAGALDLALSEDDYRSLDQAGKAVWDRFDPEDALWGWKPT